MNQEWKSIDVKAALSNGQSPVLETVSIFGDYRDYTQTA
jgi:hypothetical protein